MPADINIVHVQLTIKCVALRVKILTKRPKWPLNQLAFRFRRKKFKIDFQMGDSAGHLRFPIWTILTICDLQVTLYFIVSFQSICLPVNEKFKIDFQDDGHLKFLIETSLTISNQQVALILASTFWVNWPVRSGEEVQNTFSRWRPWWPSRSSDRRDFSYFLYTSRLDTSCQVFSQLASRFIRRRLK